MALQPSLDSILQRFLHMGHADPRLQNNPHPHSLYTEFNLLKRMFHNPPNSTFHLKPPTIFLHRQCNNKYHHANIPHRRLNKQRIHRFHQTRTQECILRRYPSNPDILNYFKNDLGKGNQGEVHTKNTQSLNSLGISIK